MLYQMATGRHPFPADTPSAQVYAILHHDPDPPRAVNPRLPDGLDAVIARAMRREPAARHESGGVLLAELRAVASGRRTEESLRRGRVYLNEAIAKDPTYALAHVGLADVYNLLGYFSYQAPGTTFPRAKAAARYALELDPSLGEAHTSLAYVHLYHDWDWAAAEREFQRGIELSPSYPQGHLWYLNVLTARGRFDEALAQGAKCLELDPLSLIANLATGWVHYFMRQYERSAAELEKGREMDPTFTPTRMNLGWTYLQMGRHAEAVRELEAAAQQAARTPTMVLTLAHGVAVAGDRARARALVESVMAQQRERYVPSYLAAIAYEALGERERAWEWLDRAVAERSHWLVLLDLEPRFDPLRSDPRWGDIRRAVGV